MGTAGYTLRSATTAKVGTVIPEQISINYDEHPALDRTLYIASIPYTGTRCLRRFFEYGKAPYASIHFPIYPGYELPDDGYYVVPMRDPIEVIYSYERRRAALPRYRGAQDSVTYLYTRRWLGYWDWLQAQRDKEYVSHIPVDRTSLMWQGDDREVKNYCTELPRLRQAIDARDRGELEELVPEYLQAVRGVIAAPISYWATLAGYDTWYL